MSEYNRYHNYSGTRQPPWDIIGNDPYRGECVSSVKHFVSGLANTTTRQWRKGQKVIGPDGTPNNIPLGTAIATFDDQGLYPSDTDRYKNSAIYLGPGIYRGSIVVMDQFPPRNPGEVGTVYYPIGGRPPQPRIIFLNNNNQRSDNSNSYYVIMVKR